MMKYYANIKNGIIVGLVDINSEGDFSEYLIIECEALPEIGVDTIEKKMRQVKNGIEEYYVVRKGIPSENYLQEKSRQKTELEDRIILENTEAKLNLEIKIEFLKEKIAKTPKFFSFAPDSNQKLLDKLEDDLKKL